MKSDQITSPPSPVHTTFSRCCPPRPASRLGSCSPACSPHWRCEVTGTALPGRHRVCFRRPAMASRRAKRAVNRCETLDPSYIPNSGLMLQDGRAELPDAGPDCLKPNPFRQAAPSRRQNELLFPYSPVSKSLQLVPASYPDSAGPGPDSASTCVEVDDRDPVFLLLDLTTFPFFETLGKSTSRP